MFNLPPLVYIIHPLRGATPEETEANFQHYLDVVAWAIKEQHVAVASWSHHYLLHKSGRLALRGDEYLRLDFAQIARCDAVWIFGDCDAISVGARAEARFARDVCYLPVRRVWPMKGGGFVLGGSVCFGDGVTRDILEEARQEYGDAETGKEPKP
jgi:hypothetical protein